VKALEPEAQMGGVVAVAGEGVVSAESVVDVGRDSGEDAVVVVLVDEIEASACWRSKTAWNMSESFRP
jgi:hypothetical protein